MTSALKSETARINGAKSQGPVTVAGLKKSSANAVQHGLTSQSHILLAGDDPAAFQKMLDEYVTTYEPANTPEKDLVEEMVGARWRIRRLETIETGLVDDELLRQEAKTGAAGPAIQLARSFRALADDSRVLELSSRYQSRLHRIHDKAYQTLCTLQQARKSKQPSEIRVTWVDRRTVPQPGQSDQTEAPAAKPDLPNEPTAAPTKEVSCQHPSGVLPGEPVF